MTSAAATVSAVALFALAAVHVYWAAGGRWGKTAAIPSLDGRAIIAPSSLGTAAIGIALCVSAFIVLACAQPIFSGSAQMVMRLGVGTLALVFAARAIGDFRYVGVFKRVRGTRFARLDTLLYTPSCFVLCVLIAIVCAFSR